MQLGSPEAVLAAAREMGIRWFLLRPGQSVQWPPAIMTRPAFVAGDTRVFRFD
jgi:hypothetical protein